MNCHDILLILDTRDIRRLTSTEKQSVESHLQDCAECASEWRTHQRVLGSRAALEMANDLPARIWSSLPTASTQQAGLRSRRTPVLGSLLLIGAAAAMIVWYLLGNPEPDSASVTIPVAPESDAVAATSGDPESSAAPSQPESSGKQDLQEPALPQNPPRHRLLVLPPTYQDPDAAAMEYFNAFYGALLGELRSKKNLEVVEVTARELEVAEADLPPSPLVGPNPPREEDIPSLIAQLEEREIAIRRHFDGEFTLRVTFVAYPGRPNTRSINAAYSGPSGSATMSTLTGPSRPGNSSSPSPGSPASQARDSGTSKARQVYARLLPDAASSQYLSVLKSPGESEASRMEALTEYLRYRSTSAEQAQSGLPDEIVEVAVELSRSDNVQTRRQIWLLLGKTETPAALQALGRALQAEPDAEARRNIAASLFNHASNPGIRAEFELAATADASAEVRLLAKLALLPDSGRVAYLLTALHDHSLTYEARMEPLRVARRGNLQFLSDLVLDEKALSEIREIAEKSSNFVVKSAANSELARASGLIRQIQPGDLK